MFSDSNITAAIKKVEGSLSSALESKYGLTDQQTIKTILDSHGMSRAHFDFIANTEKMFGGKLSDVSIDTNANKTETTIAGSLAEVAHPINKVIGFRYLYRTMKDLYGKEKAKQLTGEMYDYSLAIADSTKLLQPYSYYGHTPIHVRINGVEKVLTLKRLFDIFSDDAVYDEILDCYQIDLNNATKPFNITSAMIREWRSKNNVVDFNKWIAKEKIYEKMLVEVWDNDGWVKVTRAVKHKNSRDMVLYQTKSGDFAMVTDDHPVIMFDGSEKNSSDLCLGDEVMVRKELPVYQSTFNISVDLAYLIGFLIGDGSYNSYDIDNEFYRPDFSGRAIKFTRGGNTISIYQKNVDESHILSVAKSCFPNATFFKNSDKTDRMINFTSWEFNYLLATVFGITHKQNSFTKSLPENIMNWAEEAKCALLAGLIDSDGTVFKHSGRVDIRMQAYSVINALHDVISSIPGTVLSSKRIAGKDIENLIYGVSFRTTNENIISRSEKLSLLRREIPDIFTRKINENCSHKKDNTISKIIRFNQQDIKQTRRLYEELDFVYDITTESGTFYANGMRQHNCFSVDASKIVIEGRNFGTLPSTKPKRLISYISALNETVHQLSNHLAGALAIGSFFFDCAHVLIYREEIDIYKLKFDKETRKYIENCFQSFVHSVNHLSRNAIESPFTNISVFDRAKLKTFLSEDNMGWYFADQKFNSFNWEQYLIDYILEIQQIFMDFFDRGDVLNGGKNFRFPVVTANISKSVGEVTELLDEEFIDEMTSRDIYRYNILVSEGSKVASCCFDGDQKTLSRYENEEPKISSFSELYNNPQKTKYRVLNSGIWSKAKIIKTARNNRKLYKVTTANGKVLTMTEDHLCPTFSGNDIRVDKLTTNDYLLFASRPVDEVPETSLGLTYSDGVLIGAYLGDGCGAFSSGNQVSFSLNEEKLEILRPHFETVINYRFSDATGIRVGATFNNNVPVNITSKKLKQFITSWVSGNTASEKQINLSCLLQSVEFRKGIIAGLYMTDGGNSNRIYSTSYKLVDCIEAIFTSLGVPSVIDVSDRTNEPVIIRGEIFNRNFPLFCIRYYTPGNRGFQPEIYKIKHNSIFFRVVSIEELQNPPDYVYCFEMKDESNPYFTLPNGVITHNCRLLNNFELLEIGGQMNSFGGSGISLGSHRVVTINFNRIALECNSPEEYEEILLRRIKDAAMILEAHRALMKEFTKKGLLPFVKSGWLRLERMFSTFGVIGLVEAQETLENRFNIEIDYIERSLRILNDQARSLTIETKNIFNIEQIPAESMAPKLAAIDALLFGEESVSYKLYSNQFVPLWKQTSIYERMKEDGRYNKMFTGGGIVHFNLGERVTQEQAKALIEYAAKVGCEHFALNPIYSECSDGHTSFGKHLVCPVCGSEIVEHYTRVVGFFVPVSSFNKVRREWEFPNREFVGIEVT